MSMHMWAEFRNNPNPLAKVREMKERKRREDPNNIMNPGKHYKVITRYGIPLWGSVFRVFTSLLGVLKYF